MEKIEISKIYPPRVQLKKHSKSQLEELSKSIKEFGQYRPLLIQKSSMRIICGYGIYLALKKLKYKEVNACLLDVSDDEADNIRFTDNYSNESSKWNEDKLQYIFMELSDDLINISGFNDTEVENIFNDNIELSERGDKLEEHLSQLKNQEENVLEEVLEENDEENEEEEVKEEEEIKEVKKEDKVDVEFIKIHYCGCCGKYYDSDGNEVDLLR